jgi:hypothetical protein
MSVRRDAMQTSRAGQIFREAWVAGVRRHYQGEPKASYVASWDEMPEWERSAAAAVADQVTAFIRTTAGATVKLTREQKGRFVAICWIGQIHRHISDPKPAYVADWEDMPEWQRATDADIFERIEAVQGPV